MHKALFLSLMTCVMGFSAHATNDGERNSPSEIRPGDLQEPDRTQEGSHERGGGGAFFNAAYEESAEGQNAEANEDEYTRQHQIVKAVREGRFIDVMDRTTPDENSRLFQLPYADEEYSQLQNDPAGLTQLVDDYNATEVKVDLTNSKLHLIENGADTTFPISSARAGYANAAVGCYTKSLRFELMHYSKKYEMSPMPHSIFLYGGFAIHGTHERRMIGRPASHGCIRLKVEDATTVYEAHPTRVCITGHRPASAGSGGTVAPEGDDRSAGTPPVRRKGRDADDGPSYGEQPAPAPYYPPPQQDDRDLCLPLVGNIFGGRC